MTRNRIVMAVLLCFIFAPHLDAQNYVVADSTLIQRDVSDSYARSVYNDIREVVKGYLADSSTEPIFFHGVGSGFDISTAGTNTLLHLYCDINRRSNDLLLTVLITDYTTQQTYLSFDMTVPFFRPETAVASFAATFPERFRGRVVWEFSYRMPPQPFLNINL